MSDFVVFYSWQSDLPGGLTRTFLRSALDKACETVASDPGVEDSPRLDQDTQGLTGTPDIAQAIMDKIDSCQVFVADLSLCFDGPNGKRSPNPNVIFELGYAVAKIGWSRIILVMNSAFGSNELLPFDLRSRRCLMYHAEKGEPDRSAERKKLVAQFTAAITLIASQPVEGNGSSPAEQAIVAIENQAASRAVRVREYWAWQMGELHKMSPNLTASVQIAGDVQALIEFLEASIVQSRTLIKAWSEICSTVALLNDEQSARELVRGFSGLLVECDIKPDYFGVSQYHQFDFWKFMSHELWLVCTGIMLKELRWNLLEILIRAEFLWPQRRMRTNELRAPFYCISESIHLFDMTDKISQSFRSRVKVLRENFEAGVSPHVLSWEELVDADMFLFLAVEIQRDPSDIYKISRWWPWTQFYLNWPPGFLIEAKLSSSAGHLFNVLQIESTGPLQSALIDELNLIASASPRTWRNPVTKQLIDAIGAAK
jgi:hypothetical protein